MFYLSTLLLSVIVLTLTVLGAYCCCVVWFWLMFEFVVFVLLVCFASLGLLLMCLICLACVDLL